MNPLPPRVNNSDQHLAAPIRRRNPDAGTQLTVPHFFSPEPRRAAEPRERQYVVQAATPAIDSAPYAQAPSADAKQASGAARAEHEAGEEIEGDRTASTASTPYNGSLEQDCLPDTSSPADTISEASQPDPHFLEPRALATLSEWLEVLKARVVNVPGDGLCFLYALHAVKWRDLRYSNISTSKLHVREAIFYRRQMVAMLAVNFQTWLHHGFLNLPALRARYVPEPDGCDDRTTASAIRAFLLAFVSKSVSHVVGR